MSGGADSAAGGDIRLRHPGTRDGAAVWDLVKDSGVLDLNSSYAYLMACTHFADTSILAEDDQGLAGFVIGYRIPTRPNRLFVWQVGVDARCRGKKVAQRMLERLLDAPGGPPITHIETTITPSNGASQALFKGVARRRGADVEEREYFETGFFPAGGHEAENLFVLGPFRTFKKGE